MSFSSKAVEVVDIANGSDVVVEMSYNLTLEGTPKPQARPRLGRNGFFYTPGKKDMAALKAKIKGGIKKVPIFGSNQPVVCQHQILHEETKHSFQRQGQAKHTQGRNVS